MDFTIIDSGKRQEFETGSRRDTEEGKLDWTLLPHTALARLVRHLELGLEKYGRHNWTKGQNLGRAERSLYRHWVAYLHGEQEEDHLAALVFNACVILDHEERIRSGELPLSLDDRDPHRQLYYAADTEIIEGENDFGLDVDIDIDEEYVPRMCCGDPSDCGGKCSGCK